MESTLVMAKFLPREKIGRMLKLAVANLEKKDVSQIYFSHYLEGLLFWDANNLITMIESGK